MPTVLVVDDNAELVQLYTRILAGSGHEVYSAGNSEQCFSFLETTAPDLIILDIMMEPMDGWEVLSGIRMNQKTERVPVIMVSGKKPTHEETRQYMEWVDGYRVKPLSVKGLKAVVEDFLSFRETVDREISEVERTGAGGQVIEEYRTLRRSITSGTQMTGLFEMADEEITRCIQEKRKRLTALQREYGVTV
ncbi:MAG: response regulator [Methanomicrobiales archaeon]